MMRFIKIAVVVIGAVGILALGYYLKNGGVELPPLTQNGELPSGTESQTTNVASSAGGDLDAPKLVFKDPVVNYFVGPNEILAVTSRGDIIRKTGNDSETVTPSSSSENISTASFSFDGRRVLVGISNFFKSYDLDKEVWKDIFWMDSPAWSPKTHEVVFVDKKSKTTLSTVNVDSLVPKAKPIIDIYAEDAVVYWLKTNSFLLAEKSSAMAKSSAWKIDVQKKDWGVVALDKYGLSFVWDKDGSQGLAFTGSGKGGKLTLINEYGEAERELSYLTLPHKCVFYSNSLFCAIPDGRRQLELSFLPDDYLKESFFTDDSFVETNLSTGDVKTISSEGKFDAIKLQANDESLFFINRLDNKLYSIKR